MTPIEKINLIHKTMFEALDKKAEDNGFKNWLHMKKLLNMEKSKSSFIEETIRLALNKFSVY